MKALPYHEFIISLLINSHIIQSSNFANSHKQPLPSIEYKFKALPTIHFVHIDLVSVHPLSASSKMVNLKTYIMNHLHTEHNNNKLNSSVHFVNVCVQRDRFAIVYVFQDLCLGIIGCCGIHNSVYQLYVIYFLPFGKLTFERLKSIYTMLLPTCLFSIDQVFRPSLINVQDVMYPMHCQMHGKNTSKDSRTCVQCTNLSVASPLIFSVLLCTLFLPTP